MKHIFMVGIYVALLLCPGRAEWRIKSPDGRQELILRPSSDEMRLSYRFQGTEILADSPLGLAADAVPLVIDASATVVPTAVDRTWQPVGGKSKMVRDRYNACTIPLRRAGSNLEEGRLVIRCFDDGFAYRYQIDAPADDAAAADLSFLPAGRRYRATLYEDAADAHFLTGKERYKIETRDVASGAREVVRLAPGGGNVIPLEYDPKRS